MPTDFCNNSFILRLGSRCVVANLFVIKDRSTIWYDTVDLRALKRRRYGQLCLARGTETKKIRKNKKPSSSEETVRAKVREGSPGGRSETTGGRICETRLKCVATLPCEIFGTFLTHMASGAIFCATLITVISYVAYKIFKLHVFTCLLIYWLAVTKLFWLPFEFNFALYDVILRPLSTGTVYLLGLYKIYTFTSLTTVLNTTFGRSLLAARPRRLAPPIYLPPTA